MIVVLHSLAEGVAHQTDVVALSKLQPVQALEPRFCMRSRSRDSLGTTIFCLAILLGLAVSAGGEEFSGKKSSWHGHDRFEFTVDGRRCYVVVPKTTAEGKPWIWRARFFGHEPQADLQLLSHGFHVVYCDVANLFGSPRAVAHWDAFYSYLTEKHRFAPKVALEGMSRGGLIIYNWAAANPDKVACLYGDAPVCDFRSWPGGRGEGKGSPAEWQSCLKAYGLSEEEALAYAQNPIDNLEPLAKARIPILHVVGGADRVVPVAENSAIVERRYCELGGPIKVISKKGVGHHPHGLKDPAPIVEFVLAHSLPAGAKLDRSRNVQLRGSLDNSRIQFSRKKRGHVAFIGGSITEMHGYRPMVSDLLRKRFPDTELTFTNGGIPSTCSTTGAFRLASDVLGKGPVDLLFVEFAVNDDQDAGHARRECIRGMEGIIRQARRHNPHADIVVTYFVNPGMLAKLQRGEAPLAIASHAAVAEHYDIPTIHLAREVAERIAAKKLTWKEFGGTHPAPAGNALCAAMIDGLLEVAWRKPLSANVRKTGHPAPTRPLDPLNYGRGRFVDPKKARVADGWIYKVPEWKKLKGSKRRRFGGLPMLCGEQPGAELTLAFTGTAVGAYVVAGPDAGIVEASVDGGPVKRVDLYHRFSKGLHYPRTVMFATDLEPGEHTLKLVVSDATSSAGNAVRIMQFVAN